MSAKVQRLMAMLEADPNNDFGWYSLAMEQRKDDLTAARKTFEKLTADSPEYLPTYYQYGKVLEEAGEAERAAEVYRAGIEVARAQGDGHTLGELEEALGNL